jgi:predicted O-methyltransferase YrrM
VPDAGSTRTRPDLTAGAIWRDQEILEIDGVEFVARGTTKRFTSSRDRFCLVKRPDLVVAYLALLADLQPATIVELGVFQGGSCALMAVAAGPDVLVSVELSEERVPALDALIAERGLGDRVHVHHAVDQADAATLGDLVDRHLAGRPLDLVVDDASHLVGPTRASFNTLFPRLRPGGVYITEDWSWAHIGWGTARPTETPLTELVFEVTMALPSRPGLITELRIDHDWAVVVRGNAELDVAEFDISECYSERARALLASRAG